MMYPQSISLCLILLLETTIPPTEHLTTAHQCDGRRGNVNVIYEVNLVVNSNVAEVFAQWLKPHMDTMLTFEGFQRADWYERRGVDEGGEDGGPALWTIHYHVSDRATLEEYFSGPAKAMREDGLRRFGGQFSATRRILQPYGSAGSTKPV
jgi:hypothetical protein